MAELSTRRVLLIAAVAGAAVGGAVAGGVAAVSSSGNDAGTPSSSSRGGRVATAQVVRTDLSTTVQVGGSIGYEGAYTVLAPTGSSAQQVAQAGQAVTADEQALSADEQAETDAAAAAAQASDPQRAAVGTLSAALDSARAARRSRCAGIEASSEGCARDTRNVARAAAQLRDAEQRLDGSRSNAKLERDQNRARVAADETKLQGDRTTLAALRASAVNPGGAYTWLPAVGTVIRRDQPVYAVSDEPVPLLYGSIAAYRAFSPGMTEGPDVGELVHELIALGYGAGLTQSGRYSSAVVAAVERWQRALGLPATGEILLGEVVFEPGPIRVTSVSATVGASLGGGGAAPGGGGGTVLSATGTTPIVSVQLDVSQQYLVKPGDAVSVVLPDGTSTVGGRIETVGDVATCPGGAGTGTAAGGSSAGESPCASAGSNTNATATVPVTIALDRVPPGAKLDQAPVNVEITTQHVDGVLAVPVDALLALAGGGFGVDVVSATRSRLVGVTTGLYSNTLVQVSGAGIGPGTRVEVPSS